MPLRARWGFSAAMFRMNAWWRCSLQSCGGLLRPEAEGLCHRRGVMSNDAKIRPRGRIMTDEGGPKGRQPNAQLAALARTPDTPGGLLRVDAVGIDRSYRIASHLFNLVL